MKLGTFLLARLGKPGQGTGRAASLARALAEIGRIPGVAQAVEKGQAPQTEETTVLLKRKADLPGTSEASEDSAVKKGKMRTWQWKKQRRSRRSPRTPPKP